MIMAYEVINEESADVIILGHWQLLPNRLMKCCRGRVRISLLGRMTMRRRMRHWRLLVCCLNPTISGYPYPTFLYELC
jgi:hypothetical protein